MTRKFAAILAAFSLASSASGGFGEARGVVVTDQNRHIYNEMKSNRATLNVMVGLCAVSALAMVILMIKGRGMAVPDSPTGRAMILSLVTSFILATGISVLGRKDFNLQEKLYESEYRRRSELEPDSEEAE